MTSITYQFSTIMTERLILRAPKLSDFDKIAEFLAHPRSQIIGAGNMDKLDAWKTFSRIAGMWMLRGFGLFILEEKTSGKPLGSIGPWYPITWPEPELGWTIWDAEAEGKGYAYEAAEAARDHVFNDLGWTTAVSYIDASNTRSRNLAERLGAVIDPDAEYPGFGTPEDKDEEPCLVYRHSPKGAV